MPAWASPARRSTSCRSSRAFTRSLDPLALLGRGSPSAARAPPSAPRWISECADRHPLAPDAFDRLGPGQARIRHEAGTPPARRRCSSTPRSSPAPSGTRAAATTRRARIRLEVPLVLAWRPERRARERPRRGGSAGPALPSRGRRPLPLSLRGFRSAGTSLSLRPSPSRNPRSLPLQSGWAAAFVSSAKNVSEAAISGGEPRVQWAPPPASSNDPGVAAPCLKAAKHHADLEGSPALVNAGGARGSCERSGTPPRTRGPRASSGRRRTPPLPLLNSFRALSRILSCRWSPTFARRPRGEPAPAGPPRTAGGLPGSSDRTSSACACRRPPSSRGQLIVSRHTTRVAGQRKARAVTLLAASILTRQSCRCPSRRPAQPR